MDHGIPLHGAAEAVSFDVAVFRSPEEVEEKVTSDIVVYCSIFRLFVVNIVLP